MQNYVEHLLTDIKELKKQMLPRKQSTEPFVQAEMEEALKIANFKPLEQWIGIKKVSFPTEDRLSFKQIEALLNALLDLLFKNGFRVNFPQKSPINIRYQVLVEYLDKPTPQLEHHYWQLSVCGYDPSKCTFGSAYCQCLAWENILTDIPKQESSEMTCKVIHLSTKKVVKNPFFEIKNGVDSNLGKDK